MLVVKWRKTPFGPRQSSERILTLRVQVLYQFDITEPMVQTAIGHKKAFADVEPE